MRIKLTFPSLRQKNEFDEKFGEKFKFDFATINDNGTVEAFYKKNKAKKSEKTGQPPGEKQLNLF